MERVIKIDEAIYNTIMCTPNSPVLGWSEIAQSVPYNNPATDLINREALKKAIRAYVEPSSKLSDDFSKGMTECACEILDMIDNSSEVQPNWRFYFDHGYAQAKRDLRRPQGEWELHGMIYYCSECGHDCGESGDNFCGNCGADMRNVDIDG